MGRTLKTFVCLLLLWGNTAKAEVPPARRGPSSSRSGTSSPLPYFYLGGLFGIATPPSSIGATSRRGFGGTMALRLYNNISLGAFYLYTSKEESSGYESPYNINLIKVEAYGLELNYSLPLQHTAVFRLGARFGPSKITVNSLGLSTGTTTPLNYGTVGSLDLFLGKQVSIGIEGTVLFFGNMISYGSFITYYLNGALKLWF